MNPAQSTRLGSGQCSTPFGNTVASGRGGRSHSPGTDGIANAQLMELPSQGQTSSIEELQFHNGQPVVLSHFVLMERRCSPRLNVDLPGHVCLALVTTQLGDHWGHSQARLVHSGPCWDLINMCNPSHRELIYNGFRSPCPLQSVTLSVSFTQDLCTFNPAGKPLISLLFPFVNS